MKRFIALVSFYFLSVGMASAASLQGPLFAHVVDDRAVYAPGALAKISVDVLNRTGAAYSGDVDLAVCSRGQMVGHAQIRTLAGLRQGASRRVVYSVRVPKLDGHGYLLVLVALKPGPGSAICQGSGSNAAYPVDVATGALNIGTSDWDDPIEAFVDAPTLAGVPAADVARNLAQYHVGLIQCYDCTWRSDEPFSPAPSWKDLESVTVTRASLGRYQAALHALGMKFLAYQLWNGAFPDFPTADKHINLSMGLFDRPCGACAVADQIHTDGGVGAWKSFGWQADRIVEMNPANPAWQGWMIGQWRQLVAKDHFDGVHLDTLGAPSGPVYDASGRKILDIGTAMAGFANAAGQKLGCTDINEVSGWDLQQVAQQGKGCDLYIEPHPEFGNVPYYPSVMGLGEQLRQWTQRPLILAYYPEQQKSGVISGGTAVCDPAKQSGCMANDAGIELLFGQVAFAGASPLLLGDLDHIVPGPFFPRASLGLDGALQEELADDFNWFVAQRDLLRVGVTGSDNIITVTASDGVKLASSVGAAGQVYARAWSKPGIAAGITLTNLVGMKSNRIDDPQGDAAPPAMNNLRVTTEITGTGTPGALWFSAPDVQHGIPQAIKYQLGAADSRGRRVISFTVPVLRSVGLIDLEGGDLADAQDYRVAG
jgi:dextranase